MKDEYCRSITYLRVSVTDLCNLRCRYCMPECGVDKRDHGDILRFEEIQEIVTAAAELGVRKVRITGGEPLVRPGLPELCRIISRIPGVEELDLTTNGLLLERDARALKEAGVHRVNISLDTLPAGPVCGHDPGRGFGAGAPGHQGSPSSGAHPHQTQHGADRGF